MAIVELSIAYAAAHGKQMDSSFVLDKNVIVVIVWTAVTVSVAIYFFLTTLRTRRPLSTSSPSEQHARSCERNERSSCFAHGTHHSHSNRINGRPAISIASNGIILKIGDKCDANSTANTTQVTVIPDSLDSFIELCNLSDVYFICRVSNDREEELVRSVVSGLRNSGCKLPDHRILFSSTTEGRASMVRQLRPDTHIDTDRNVIDALTGKVPNLVFISNASADKMEVGNTSTTTFQNFVILLRAAIVKN